MKSGPCPVRIRSQEELNSFIDSVVVIVSPWSMLSTEPTKLAYPRRQENEAMSAGLVRAFLLLVLWKGNPGYCLVVFKRDHQQKVYLKQEMCSMLQPPYFTYVLLVSLLLGWWKV